jgi:hypothetical protein
VNARFAIVLLALTGVSGAKAYVEPTHALMTREAYVRSQLVNSPVPLFITLGIFGKAGESPRQYWDMQDPSTEILRKVDEDNPKDSKVWEKGILETFGAADTSDTKISLRPVGWLMRGAIREDDVGKIISTHFTKIFADNPLDDPYYPNLVRVLHHFFDPAKNKPFDLFVPFLSEIEPSPTRAPDWAFGYVDSFAAVQDLAPNSSRRNHFSILDAREAMWRALTGMRRDRTLVGSDPDTRSTYWATTFRALGDAVHLVQDMAQPQHTRNDAHLAIPGMASVYEKRMGMRATQQKINRRFGASFSLPALELGSLSPVMFARLSDFFSTSLTNVGAGKGMADYSNRGFFTIGTNFQANSYVFPSNNLNDYGSVDIGGHTFLTGTVPDLVFNTETNVKLSTYGAWNQAMSESSGSPAFTLVDENYDDMARLLIPRAVAYSTGLIDYFFRGKLQIKLPPEKVYAAADVSTSTGFDTLKVMVKNVTPAITPPGGSAVAQSTVASGKLTAVLRYRRNECLELPTLNGSPHFNLDGTSNVVWDEENCRVPPLTSTDPTKKNQPLPLILVSNPSDLPAEGIDTALQPVLFTFPAALPFNAIDVDLQVIYRGQLGSEPDGMAIGFEHMSEPTFFNFDNNLDCFTDRQCPALSPEPSCSVTDSVKLPFPEAQDETGWRQVVSIAGLKPGQYGRVGFLTQAAFREAPPATLAVVVNQNYPYEVDVTFPDGGTETWLPGVTIRSPLNVSRSMMVNGSPKTSLAWWGHGTYKITCVNGTCGPFAWASTCSPIDSVPQPVTVMFPNP